MLYLKLIVFVWFGSAEASLELVSQTEAEEPAQPSDEASLPSTSQEPSSSSAGDLYEKLIWKMVVIL